MKELIKNMSVFNTKAYKFNSWLNRQGKAKVTFYSNLPSAPSYYAGNEEHINIDLDDEDIEYFKNKYFPQLDNEMEEKINKIKQEYGK